MKSNTINIKEIQKFSKMADEWWDPNGKFKPLHKFNPVRIHYIKNNIIKHFHKNTKHNLVPLCESCHHKVHNENLRIYGYIQSSEGIKLNYEYIEEKEVLLEKNNKKKYNKKDIKTILKYKKDIEDKKISKTN